MPPPTIVDVIVFVLGNPFCWFLLLMLAMLGNYLVVYGMADAYLRRKRLTPLERPDFGDREAEGRVIWQLLTLRDAPDMGAGLKISLWLNRILIVTLALCLLTLFGNLAWRCVTGH